MKTLIHKFVEFIPKEIEEGILYISVQYKTARHLCICGCGTIVPTPLKPDGWKLIFDGDTVSLYPSISNRAFVCQSHYWIERNLVRKAYDKVEDSFCDTSNKKKRKKFWFRKRKK